MSDQSDVDSLSPEEKAKQGQKEAEKQKRQQPTFNLPIVTDDAEVKFQTITEDDFDERVKDCTDKEFIFKAPPASSLKTNKDFMVMSILPLYDVLRYALPISHLASDSSAWQTRKTYPENASTPATAGFKKKSDGTLSLRIHSDRGYQGRMNSYAAMYVYLRNIKPDYPVVLTQQAHDKKELNAMANRMVAVMMVTEAKNNKDDLSNQTNFDYYFTKSCNRVSNPEMNFKFSKSEVEKQVKIFQKIDEQFKLDKHAAQIEDKKHSAPEVGRNTGVPVSEGKNPPSLRVK